jgi:alkylated DNA repair dioxygenase AlkB
MERIALSDGGVCELHARWLNAREAKHAFTALMAEVSWQSRTIQIFGREVLQPRLVSWVGDAEAVYTYSRTRHEPWPWTKVLHELRTRVSQVAGIELNSVLCNLYRDGRDSMGFHSDSEPELGPDPIIASLSLGATRRFCLRHRDHPARDKLELALDDGSLLLMRGTTQRYYRHGVPKEPKILEPRINLTFRRVLSITA